MQPQVWQYILRFRTEYKQREGKIGKFDLINIKCFSGLKK